MGKINKFANLYNKDGEKIRSVDPKKGILTDVSIEELEKMIDEYPENGDKLALDRMKMYLFNMYQTFGNPHEKELIDRIKAYADSKTKPEEVTEKLNEMTEDLHGNTDIEGDVDQVETKEKEFASDGSEYVDFEEVA